jgi:hypothetical protein
MTLSKMVFLSFIAIVPHFGLCTYIATSIETIVRGFCMCCKSSKYLNRDSIVFLSVSIHVSEQVEEIAITIVSINDEYANRLCNFKE